MTPTFGPGCWPSSGWAPPCGGADIDPETCELPVRQYDDLVSYRTRLGALVYVDGVHAAPQVPLDVAALRADFFALSSYLLTY